jgi:predicted RNase H-like nuclease (RuvC/YqgF family)
MDIDELRERVEQKTRTVSLLEVLLEKNEAELVELERQLEAMEDSQGPDARVDHPAIPLDDA